MKVKNRDLPLSPNDKLDNTNSLILNFQAREGTTSSNAGRRTAEDKYGDSKCLSVDKRLTAIVPGIDNQSFPSLTAQKHPTFWFYIPYSSDSTSPLVAEFSLLTKNTENNNIRILEKTYELEGTPGIIGISLPETTPLEINRNYRWVFSIICNPQDRSEDMYVSGLVQRVNQNQIPPLTATPNQRAVIYAEDGLWNDTLTTIICEVLPRERQQARLLIKQLFESEYVRLEIFKEERIISKSCTLTTLLD
ncbi:MAG: DUF928 domain-containing protein [Kamptonema sp. SIO1D9]|nr:DUF928 domain-containing protein [Kamptonema sp. SIO1D9]